MSPISRWIAVSTQILTPWVVHATKSAEAAMAKGVSGMASRVAAAAPHSRTATERGRPIRATNRGVVTAARAKPTPDAPRTAPNPVSYTHLIVLVLSGPRLQARAAARASARAGAGAVSAGEPEGMPLSLIHI